MVTIENAGGEVGLSTGKRCTIDVFPLRDELADGGMLRLIGIVEEQILTGGDL